MSFALVPAATLALSAFTYKVVWLDEDNTLSLRKLVQVCMTNSAGWFRKDVVSSSFAPRLDDVVCTRLAFAKQLFNDRSGPGVFLIYGSILFPLILRLCYKAASPNNRSFVSGVLLPALGFLLTSTSTLLLGSGVGLFVPSFISLLYAAFSSKSKTSTQSVPLPAVARAIYGVNLAIIASTFLFVLQIASGGGGGGGAEEDDMSMLEYYLPRDVVHTIDLLSGVFYDVFPLLVSLPLLYLGFQGLPKPRNEQEASEYLKENYLASEVAYGFERTWAYYRQTGLLSAVAYLYGVSRIFRNNIFGRETLSSASIYLLFVSAIVSLVHLSFLFTDASNSPKDAVDEEAEKAIAKAPAGNPGLDNKALSLAILAVFSGPSLPLMLWYARGEEFRGWKGRRAWRLAMADQKAIQ